MRRVFVPLFAGALALGVFEACTGDDPDSADPGCADGTVCGPGLICMSHRCVIADAGSTDAPASDAGTGTGRRAVDDAWARDLLVYWPFDGDSLDYSGNALDLDVSDTAFEPGLVANALRRSPTSLVKRPHYDALLSLGDVAYTLQFWVYVEESKSGVVMSQLDPVTSEGWSLDRAIIVEDERLNLVAYGDGGVKNALGPSVLVKQWSHYAIVRSDDGRIAMYRNGVFTNEAFVTIVPAMTALFRLGESVSNPTRNLNGMIDEVAIWKRALSATEIALLYGAGKGQTLFRP